MRTTTLLAVGTALMITVTGASIGIPLLRNHLDNQEAEVVELEFTQAVDNVEARVRSNITAVTDYLLHATVGLDQMSTMTLDLPESNHEALKLLGAQPANQTKFANLRIAYSRIADNLADRAEISELGKKLYNVSSFEPFNIDLNETGQTFPTPVDEHPIGMLVVFHPELESLPSLGSFNIIGGIGQDTFDDTLTLADGRFAVSPVRINTRSDGVTVTRISFNLIRRPWITTALFDPRVFLTDIIPATSRFNFEMADEHGVFFESDPDLESVGSQNRTIEFANRRWTLTGHISTVFLEELTTDSPAIIEGVLAGFTVLVGLFILAVTTASVMFARKTVAEHEAESNRRVVSIQSGNRVLLHEQRNLLNTAHMIMQAKRNDQFTETDLDLIRASFQRLISICTNHLDYEKLLMRKYTPTYDQFNLLDEIVSIARLLTPITTQITYHELDTILLADRGKLAAMISNGINNAAKHSVDRRIAIRIQRFDNWLLVEIMNRVDDWKIDDTDPLFVPYFFRENSQLKPQEQKRLIEWLKMNQAKRKFVADRFGIDRLDHLREIPAVSESAQSLNFESTGLGLPVSRLTARALGGECGLEYDPPGQLVRFWFLVQVKKPVEVDV